MMNEYHKSGLPVRALFPDTFEDVLHALLNYLPAFRMPCMREFLIGRAEFLTIWLIARYEEYGWEFPEDMKDGREVTMSISFSDAPEVIPSQNRVRRYMNRAFVEDTIYNYANTLTLKRQRLKQRK